MNVLVITPGALPVPAHKGGAVEALIESYIKYNEILHECDFTIYSVKDEKDYNSDYKYTCFEYIDTQNFFYKIKQAIRYIINNKLPKIHIGNAYIVEVIKKLKKSEKKYDKIIVENCPFYVLKLRKVYPDTQIICHLHNDYLNIKTKYAKKIAKEYDEIIAISDYIKEKVQNIGTANNIETIYNGVNTDIFSKKIPQEKINEYRKKYNIKEEDKVFLYVGRLIYEKGVKELVLAFVKLLKNYKNMNYKLLIIR